MAKVLHANNNGYLNDPTFKLSKKKSRLASTTSLSIAFLFCLETISRFLTTPRQEKRQDTKRGAVGVNVMGPQHGSERTHLPPS